MSGPSREQYVIKKSNFEKNYHDSSNFEKLAQGEKVSINPIIGKPVIPEQSPRTVARIDEPISEKGLKFKAPWGEDMVARHGDIIVRESKKDMYRVERGAFEDTYNPLSYSSGKIPNFNIISNAFKAIKGGASAVSNSIKKVIQGGKQKFVNEWSLMKDQASKVAKLEEYGMKTPAAIAFSKRPAQDIYKALKDQSSQLEINRYAKQVQKNMDEKYPVPYNDFAEGLIPSFFDVYRGIRVPKNSKFTSQDVFQPDPKSRKAFRASDVYDMQSLHRYLSNHVDSAIGTGMVSSSTNINHSKKFATTNNPLEQGVVAKKSMSHKRIYNPRKTEQLVKFLMERRGWSEAKAVQWFVSQAKNKDIGFDMKRWMDKEQFKKHHREDEVGILTKSSFADKDVLAPFSGGFIPSFSPALMSSWKERAMTGTNRANRLARENVAGAAQRASLGEILKQREYYRLLEESVMNYRMVHPGTKLKSSSSSRALDGSNTELSNYFNSKEFRQLQSKTIDIDGNTINAGKIISEKLKQAYPQQSQPRLIGDERSERMIAFSNASGLLPNFANALTTENYNIANFSAMRAAQIEKAMTGSSSLRHADALRKVEVSRQAMLSSVLKDARTRSKIKKSLEEYNQNRYMSTNDTKSLLKIKSDDTIAPVSEFNKYLNSQSFSKIKGTTVKVGDKETTIEKLFTESQANTYMPTGIGDDSVRQIAYMQSDGLVPNFASGYNSERKGVSDAISRETEALKKRGVSSPRSKIKVQRSPRLKNPQNPKGLGVINTIDEPRGINQGIDRAVSMGINPHTHGMAAHGAVPNFRIKIPGLSKMFRRGGAGGAAAGGGAIQTAGATASAASGGSGMGFQMGIMMLPMVMGGFEGEAGTAGGMAAGAASSGANAAATVAMITDKKKWMGLAAAAGAAYGALDKYAAGTQAVIKAVQEQIGNQKRLIEGSDQLIASQEKLNAAIQSGDTDRITKSIEAFQDVLYDFPTDLPGGDKLRESLLAAGGDVGKMTEALGDFQKEARKVAELGQIKMQVAEATAGEGREGVLPFGIGPSELPEWLKGPASLIGIDGTGELNEAGQKGFETSGGQLVKTLKMGGKEVDGFSQAIYDAGSSTADLRKNLESFANTLDEDTKQSFLEILNSIPDDGLRRSFAKGMQEMGKSVKTGEAAAAALNKTNAALASMTSQVRKFTNAVNESFMELSKGIDHAFAMAEQELSLNLDLMEGLNLITPEQKRETQTQFDVTKMNARTAAGTEGLVNDFVNEMAKNMEPSEMQKDGSIMEGPLGSILKKMQSRGNDPIGEIRFNAKDVLGEILNKPQDERSPEEAELVNQVKQLNQANQRQIDLLNQQNRLIERQEAMEQRIRLQNTQLDYGNIAPMMGQMAYTTQNRGTSMLAVDSAARSTQSAINLVKGLFGETESLNKLEKDTGEKVAIGNVMRILQSQGLKIDGPGFFDEMPEGFDMKDMIAVVERAIVDNDDTASDEQLTILRAVADGLRNQEREMSSMPVSPEEIQSNLVKSTASALNIDLGELYGMDSKGFDASDLGFDALTNIGKELSEDGTQVKLLQGIKVEIANLPQEIGSILVPHLKDQANDLASGDQKRVDAREKSKVDSEKTRQEIQSIASGDSSSSVSSAESINVGGSVSVSTDQISQSAQEIVVNAGSIQIPEIVIPPFDVPVAAGQGIVPNFAPSPIQRAVETERKMGGKPFIDRHPSLKALNPKGFYVRDLSVQKNFQDVKRTHPEGMSAAIENSKISQGLQSQDFSVPNFAILDKEVKEIESMSSEVTSSGKPSVESVDSRGVNLTQEKPMTSEEMKSHSVIQDLKAGKQLNKYVPEEKPMTSEEMKSHSVIQDLKAGKQLNKYVPEEKPRLIFGSEMESGVKQNIEEIRRAKIAEAGAEPSVDSQEAMESTSEELLGSTVEKAMSSDKGKSATRDNRFNRFTVIGATAGAAGFGGIRRNKDGSYNADPEWEKRAQRLGEETADSKKAKATDADVKAKATDADVKAIAADAETRATAADAEAKAKRQAAQAGKTFTEERVNVGATDRADTKTYSAAGQNEKAKSVERAQRVVDEQKTVAKPTVESVDERMSKFQSKIDADEKLSQAKKSITSTDAKYRKILGIDVDKSVFLPDGTPAKNFAENSPLYKKQFKTLGRMLHPDARNFDGETGRSKIAKFFPEIENLRGDPDAIKEFKFRKMQELTAAKADWEKMFNVGQEMEAIHDKSGKNLREALSPEEKSSLMKQRQEALTDRMKIVQQNPDAQFKQPIPDWMDDWMRTNPDAFEEIVEQETIKGKTYENWDEAEIKQWEAESGEKIQKRAEARQAKETAAAQAKADQQVKTDQQAKVAQPEPEASTRTTKIDDEVKKDRVKRMGDSLKDAEDVAKPKRTIRDRIRDAGRKIFTRKSRGDSVDASVSKTEAASKAAKAEESIKQDTSKKAKDKKKYKLREKDGTRKTFKINRGDSVKTSVRATGTGAFGRGG